MTTTTMTYTGTLIVETCCVCQTQHAFPSGLHDRMLADHKVSVYCPNGHSWHFIGETEAEKERRLRKRAEDQAAAERARADGAEASLRTTKGHVTRLRKRALDGECPLCGQHLRDVARHVARVHGGETPEGES